MQPTPNLPTSINYQKVYEPYEDTFLFLDALESETESGYLHDYLELGCRKPAIVFEIGCGSGCVSAFIPSLMKKKGCFIYSCASDINSYATEITKQTCRMNNLDIDTVVSSFCPFRKGCVDVLLFNPPYVVTPPEEVGKRDDISAAWAGGINGRQVIDELLPLVNGILSDDGVFYMVVINENKPLEILEEIKEYGLVGSVCFRRKAGIEGLSVLRITKMRS